MRHHGEPLMLSSALVICQVTLHSDLADMVVRYCCLITGEADANDHVTSQ